MGQPERYNPSEGKAGKLREVGAKALQFTLGYGYCIGFGAGVAARTVRDMVRDSGIPSEARRAVGVFGVEHLRAAVGCIGIGLRERLDFISMDPGAPPVAPVSGSLARPVPLAEVAGPPSDVV